MAAKGKSDDLEHLHHDRSLANDHTVGTSVAVNHDEEDAYWRQNHVREPYYSPDYSYDDYGPAYRMGWESRARYDQGTFDTYEPSFRNDWDESFRGQSRLTWAQARHAARAGWERVERKGEAEGTDSARENPRLHR